MGTFFSFSGVRTLTGDDLQFLLQINNQNSIGVFQEGSERSAACCVDFDPQFYYLFVQKIG